MSEHGRTVHAPRGLALRCRGWRQESILRMLENTVDVGEDPQNLTVYSGWARAARDWVSFDAICEVLRTMDESMTLVVQSGKPVALLHTGAHAPLVVIANGNLVDAHGESTYRDLAERGLTTYPGMTAGAWQYIGSQGILQGTYETFMAVAREHFDGSLRGRLIVSAGLGGMGGAQPLAAVMADAVALVVEADRQRVRRRFDEGYLQRQTESLGEALQWCREAVEESKPASVGLVGNVAEVFSELVRRDVTPDVVTDQTSTDPYRGYVPGGVGPDEVDRLRSSDPRHLAARCRATLVVHVQAMLELQRRGAVTFEYGNRLRARGVEAGVTDAFDIPVFTERYIRPLFCRGIGPFRWIAMSGDPQDIHTIDDLVLSHFAGESIADWIVKAQTHLSPTRGLPARIGWLGHEERSRLAVLVNDAIHDGRIRGPVAFTRDHLDAGSVAAPYRETEKMADGSDRIADWPLLNAQLSCASGADLVAVNSQLGYMLSSGLTVIADGTEAGSRRLRTALDNDTALGIARFADAGYDIAREVAEKYGLELFTTVAPPADGVKS